MNEDLKINRAHTNNDECSLVSPKSQQGFSLMELLIVIAIIGILGAIAMPNYKKYILRANLVELFSHAQPMKLAVTEALIDHMPLTAINTHSLGLRPIENKGKIRRLSIEAGVIHIIGDGGKLGLNDVEELEIRLSPQISEDTIDWQCSTSTQSIRPLLPRHCQE